MGGSSDSYGGSISSLEKGRIKRQSVQRRRDPSYKNGIRNYGMRCSLTGMDIKAVMMAYLEDFR